MDEINRLWAREIAAKHQIDERTLTKALRGEPIRVLAVAERARKAADEYRQRKAAEGDTSK